MMNNVMGWNNPAEDVLAYSNGQYQEGISNYRSIFGALYDSRVYGDTFGIHRTDLTSPIYFESGNRFSMTGVSDKYDGSETDTIYQGYGYPKNSPGGGFIWGYSQNVLNLLKPDHHL